MQQANLLIIEDNRADIDLLVYTFKKFKIRNQLNVIYDGEDALNFAKGLSNTGIQPDLILLDLNLPKVNGIEILKELKGSDLHRHVPIVILSNTYTEEKDHDLKSLGAQMLIEKPLTFHKLIDALSKAQGLSLSIIKQATHD